MMELVVLGILRDGAQYGYKLKRLIEGMTGYFGRVSYGSLYPALAKLRKAGYVAATKESGRGPARIIYDLTPGGRKAFDDLMRDPDVPLAPKLFFFDAIPHVTRSVLLDHEKARLFTELERCLDEAERFSEEPAARYRAALVKRQTDRVRADLAWVERLITAEEAQAVGT